MKACMNWPRTSNWFYHRALQMCFVWSIDHSLFVWANVVLEEIKVMIMHQWKEWVLGGPNPWLSHYPRKATFSRTRTTERLASSATQAKLYWRSHWTDWRQVVLGCRRLQLTFLSSVITLQPPLLCEGWGGLPLCLPGDSSVLMDVHWPCNCTAQSSILSIGSVSRVLLWSIFLNDLGQ